MNKQSSPHLECVTTDISKSAVLDKIQTKPIEVERPGDKIQKREANKKPKIFETF